MAIAAICEVFNVGPDPKKNPVEIGLEAHKVDTTKNETVSPGEKIPFVAKVYNDGIDCYLRVSIKYVSGKTNEAEYLSDLSKDLEKHGEYYYYKKIFKAKETLDLFSAIVIPEDIRERIANDQVKLELSAQAIQAKNFEPDYSLKDPWKNIIPEDNTHKIYYVLDDLEVDSEEKTEENKIDLSIIIFIAAAIALIIIMILYSREKKKTEDNNV